MSSAGATMSLDPENPQGPAPGPETLAALLHELRPRIQFFLLRFDIPPEDAEDILQNVALTALLKWDSIRTKDLWLIGTLRLQCFRYWRQRRKDILLRVESDELEALSAPVPPIQEQEEKIWDLEKLCRSFSPRHRILLRLRFWYGFSNEELGSWLGYSPGSIRRLSSRALARLQSRLSGRRSGARRARPWKPGRQPGDGAGAGAGPKPA